MHPLNVAGASPKATLCGGSWARGTLGLVSPPGGGFSPFHLDLIKSAARKSERTPPCPVSLHGPGDRRAVKHLCCPRRTGCQAQPGPPAVPTRRPGRRGRPPFQGGEGEPSPRKASLYNPILQSSAGRAQAPGRGLQNKVPSKHAHSWPQARAPQYALSCAHLPRAYCVPDLRSEPPGEGGPGARGACWQEREQLLACTGLVLGETDGALCRETETVPTHMFPGGTARGADSASTGHPPETKLGRDRLRRNQAPHGDRKHAGRRVAEGERRAPGNALRCSRSLRCTLLFNPKKSNSTEPQVWKSAACSVLKPH